MSDYKSSSSYVFNIGADNSVLSVAKVDSRGRIKSERIDANETYTVVDGYVIHQEFGRYGQTEWSVYADLSRNGRYTEIAEGKGAVDFASLTNEISELNAIAGPIVPGVAVGNEKYVFAIDELGAVTAAGEISRAGYVKVDYISPNENYSVLDGYVVKEEVGRYGQVEWSIYADSDADGRYTEVAEGKGVTDYAALTQSLDQIGPDLEALNFRLEVGRESHVFNFDALGNATSVGEIGRNGQIYAERIGLNESYTKVEGFVVHTEMSRYGQTEWTVYSDGDGDNRWAEVAEGHGTFSADLIAQVMPLNLAMFG